MNTEKSDRIVKKWAAKDNPLKRASITAERTFTTSPETLFRLLCPTTEYDWVPGWRCELLHSESGYAEFNAVFRTDFFGVDEIFVCTRYEFGKAVDYSRTSKDFGAKLDIRLTDNGDGTVTGRWVITASALTEQGNEVVDGLESTRQHFEAILDGLEHYLSTGQMVA